MNKRLKKIFDENDLKKKFNIDEAVELAINTATTKFDETIEAHLRLANFPEPDQLQEEQRPPQLKPLDCQLDR